MRIPTPTSEVQTAEPLLRGLILSPTPVALLRVAGLQSRNQHHYGDRHFAEARPCGIRHFRCSTRFDFLLAKEKLPYRF